MALLRAGELSVTDVCFAVGFSSLGSFSTQFRRFVGDSPSAYRHATVTTTGEGAELLRTDVDPPRGRMLSGQFSRSRLRPAS